MSAPSNRPFDRHRAELDVTHHAVSQDLRSATLMVLAGALTAALLGAAPLNDWVLQLSLDWGPAVEPLTRAATTWQHWMEGLGLTEMHRAVHDWLDALRFATW